MAVAGPPAFDPHNSCVASVVFTGPFVLPPLPAVPATFSHFAPLGTSLPACFGPGPFAPYVSEWGGHGAGCPAPPFVGAVAGAYCGPVIPPGFFATCSWIPVLNTVPTGLVIGFDGFAPGGFPGADGFVNLFASGEVPVFGPYPPSTSTIPPTGWSAPNPYPVPARVIAFPTDLVGAGFAGGDSNLIVC